MKYQTIPTKLVISEQTYTRMYTMIVTSNMLLRPAKKWQQASDSTLIIIRFLFLYLACTPQKSHSHILKIRSLAIVICASRVAILLIREPMSSRIGRKKTSTSAPISFSSLSFTRVRLKNCSPAMRREEASSVAMGSPSSVSDSSCYKEGFQCKQEIEVYVYIQNCARLQIMMIQHQFTLALTTKVVKMKHDTVPQCHLSSICNLSSLCSTV